MGPAHFDRLNKSKAITRLVWRLNDLGFQVELRHLA
jgi:hypothetical protein